MVIGIHATATMATGLSRCKRELDARSTYIYYFINALTVSILESIVYIILYKPQAIYMMRVSSFYHFKVK